jgi:hypothetical protein
MMPQAEWAECDAKASDIPAFEEQDRFETPGEYEEWKKLFLRNPLPIWISAERAKELGYSSQASYTVYTLLAFS